MKGPKCPATQEKNVQCPSRMDEIMCNINNYACKIGNNVRKCLFSKRKTGRSVSPAAKNSIFCIHTKCHKKMHLSVNRAGLWTRT